MLPFGRFSTAGDDRRAPFGRNALFPLTPALSRGEREKPVPRCDWSVPVGFAITQPKIPPLPGGEGRGEGEQGHLRLNARSSSQIRQTR